MPENPRAIQEKWNMRGNVLFTAVLSVAVTVHSQSVSLLPPTKAGIQKLDSQLWEIALSANGLRKPLALPRGFQATNDGKVVVFLVPEHGKTTGSIDLEGIREVDGEVLATSKHYIRAAIPPELLEKATRIQGVRFIQRPIRPQSQQQVISEGAAKINAVPNHSRGVKGKDTKVAVIDPEFAYGLLVYSLGELSDSTRYQDFTQSTNDSMFTGTGVHGTACAEIVYDIAPEAGFYLYKIDDLVDFENAKDACILNKIDIVSYSGAWLGTGFGDGQGIACDIVNDAADKGILWVNSAGNYAASQFSGLWADKEPNSWMNFAAEGDEVLGLKGVVPTGETIDVWLTWNDWPASSQDYDLYLYRIPENGEIEKIDASIDYQLFSDPVEHIEYEVLTPGKYGIAVSKAENARTELIKIWSKNRDFDYPSALVGTIGSPADARGSLSVGAVDQRNWSSGTIESYSSRGPTVDGRIKPDLVAPTGVSTFSYGATAFWGTSAAAPHVAGAAALIKSANPSYTRSQLVDALVAATVDLGDRGKDNTYGAGKLVLPLLQVPSGPRISTLSPQSVKYGETLAIRGQGFGTSRGTGKVVFNGNVEPASSDYVSWSDTEIRVRVPTGARKGEIRVTNNQSASMTASLTITSPWIGSISPTSVKTTQRITVTGENFGVSRGTSSVNIGSVLVSAASIATWSDASISLTVPVNTPPGNVTVTTGQGRSNAVGLGITSPYLTSLTPTSAARGAQVTLAGGNFGTSQGTGYVVFGSVRASANDYMSWSNSRIVVKVPASAQSGDVKVVTPNGESGSIKIEVQTESVERLPYPGVLGYNPPTVAGNPKRVRFEFQGIGKDLVLRYELREVSANEVRIYINDRDYGSFSEDSGDWTGWTTYLSSSYLRSGRNIIEFRHQSNQSRSSGYERWQIRNVTLWKPFDAKSVTGDKWQQLPPSSILGDPYPSPFNSSVTVPIRLVTDSQIGAAVYDLAGQKVRTLYEGTKPAGTHSLVWDGQNDDGSSVASGVYLIVVDTRQLREKARVVLLR